MMLTLPDWAFWLAFAVMLVGLVGALLPSVPGVVLIWAAALAYAWSEHFATITPPLFAVLTILAALGATADIWVSHSLGHMGGASGRALVVGSILGFLGLIAGLLLGGIGAIPGALIGTIGGIVLVEYRRRREWGGTAKAAVGWLVGYLISSLVEFSLGVVMVGLFVWRVGLR